MRVNYSKIDDAINKISDLNNDGLHEKIQALKDEFSYSQSDYVDKLNEMANDLWEIHKVLNSLISSSKTMLNVAKEIYENSEEEMCEQMEVEG